MHTTVIFTAAPQTGLTTKLSLAIKRLGYKFISVKIVKSPQNSLDQVIFVIDTEATLSSVDFSTIVSGPYGVQQVNISTTTIAQSASEAVNVAFKATARAAPAGTKAPARPKKESIRSLMSRHGSS